MLSPGALSSNTTWLTSRLVARPSDAGADPGSLGLGACSACDACAAISCGVARATKPRQSGRGPARMASMIVRKGQPCTHMPHT